MQVVNLSRSGARPRDVLDTQPPPALLQALERPPHVVTVAIGGNDLAGYDAALPAAQAAQLADGLPAGAYVADAPSFMHGRWERDSRQAADLLTAAAARRGLRPVALHEAQQARVAGDADRLRRGLVPPERPRPPRVGGRLLDEARVRPPATGSTGW